MSAPWIVAVVEAAAILGLLIVWRISVRRRRSLQRQIVRLQEGRPRRRSVLSPEGAVKAVWDTATLVRDKGVGGALRSSIFDIAKWAEVERPELVQLAGVDGCVAIVFSDIEGSTAMNDRLGDRDFVKMLAQHNALLDAEIDRHHGQVIKTQGDGYMVGFATAEQAVRCAIAIERRIARRRSKPAFAVRIGIHYGSVVHRDNDIFGRNVALAARVAAMAEGGQIVVSGEIVDQVAEIDDLDLRLDDLRAVELRGLAGEHPVATVDWLE